MLRGGTGKKIITSVAFRDSCVALCHGVPPPRSFTRAIFDSRSLFFAPRPRRNACYAGYRGPRERCRWVLRGGVKKKVIGRGPREQCGFEPRGGVKEKEMIGRRPREQCVSFPLFGRKSALQGRKEHNAKGVWERAESRGLSCCN